jgi:endo-1,4-beta-xylanase
VSFGTGDEAFQQARVQSATALVDGGYVVELSVSLLDAGGPGTFHGLDFQVNDASNGARTSIRNWADPTGAGYQSTARWGVGRLMPPEDGGPTIELSAGTVHPGGTVSVALSGFEPGTEVQLVLADQQPGGAFGSAVPMAIELPATLATLTVGEDGTASGTATIPADTPVGGYRLYAVVDGTALASAALVVVAVPPAAMALTGLAVGAGVWLALAALSAGLVLLLLRRRVRAA